MGTWTGNGMTRTQDMDLSASVSVSELSTGDDGDGIPLMVHPLESRYLEESLLGEKHESTSSFLTFES